MISKAKLAYILCAGNAVRLKPLSDILPKPLMPMVDKPMVFTIIDQLVSIGVINFIFNTHAHAGLIKKEISAYCSENNVGATFLYEEELLDTGGALLNAKELLNKPFWLVNGDIICDTSVFQDVESSHHGLASIAVRVLKLGDKFNPIGISDIGKLVRVNPYFGEGGKDMQFIGIHRLEPDIVDFLPQEKIHKIFNGLYKNMYDNKKPINTVTVDSVFSGDPGIPTGYLEANRYQLRNFGSTWIAKDSEIDETADIHSGTVVSSGCSIGKGVNIQNSVIFPGITIPENITIVDSIIADSPVSDISCSMFVNGEETAITR